MTQIAPSRLSEPSHPTSGVASASSHMSPRSPPPRDDNSSDGFSLSPAVCLGPHGGLPGAPRQLQTPSRVVVRSTIFVERRRRASTVVVRPRHPIGAPHGFGQWQPRSSSDRASEARLRVIRSSPSERAAAGGAIPPPWGGGPSAVISLDPKRMDASLT